MVLAAIWRLVIAILVVLFVFAAIPLAAQVFGFTITGPAWQLIRMCIGALAVGYILLGNRPGPGFYNW